MDSALHVARRQARPNARTRACTRVLAGPREQTGLRGLFTFRERWLFFFCCWLPLWEAARSASGVPCVKWVSSQGGLHTRQLGGMLRRRPHVNPVHQADTKHTYTHHQADTKHIHTKHTHSPNTHSLTLTLTHAHAHAHAHARTRTHDTRHTTHTTHPETILDQVACPILLDLLLARGQARGKLTKSAFSRS